MLDVLKTKSIQTSILAALLFYLFANPSTFKMLKKFPWITICHEEYHSNYTLGSSGKCPIIRHCIILMRILNQ